MTDVPALDLKDPAFAITSPAVHAAREQSWYAETPYGIAVLRYEEMKQLLKHPQLRQGSIAWPALNGVTEGPFARWYASWVLNQEGPDHRRLRRLMNPAFSPRLLRTMGPRFEALAHELIDGYAEPGRCEFMAEFAEPYAARVIAIMLGLPEEEWEVIAGDSATIGLAMSLALKDELPAIEAALGRLHDYADRVIADRRANPRDDFSTAFVNASHEHDKLSNDELRDGMVLLIFGGFDTTRNQLGLAVQCFLRHPDQWELLARRPDLGPAAVEEVMRVNPTTRWVTREALADFDFQGLRIEQGTTLHLLTESAGTDPRVFAGDFDITADHEPHFGFGGGVHHCLGHFVARTDMAAALPLLAQRMPGLHALPGDDWLPDSGNTGPQRLPVGFDPA